MNSNKVKISTDNMNEKTRQLLLYLIKNNPKVSITSLMKLAYLADLISIKRIKNRISNFEYRRYYFGPFDKKIYNYIEYLTEKNLIISESDYGLTGEEFSVFSLNPKKEAGIEFKKLKDTEKKIIDELLNSVKGYGAKILTEIAYKTDPMKALGATLGGSQNLGKKLNLRA